MRRLMMAAAAAIAATSQAAWADDLSVSSLGPWNRPMMRPTAIAHADDPPTQRMPVRGSATYAGRTTGTLSSQVFQGTTTEPLAGHVSIDANFASQTLSGTVSHLRSQGQPLDRIDSFLPTTIHYGADLGSFSRISGSSFTAFIVSDKPFLAGGQDQTDALSGQFRGPAAQVASGGWFARVNRNPVFLKGDPGTPANLLADPNCTCQHPLFSLNGTFTLPQTRGRH
jgi:hypothetical protein